MIRVGIAGAAGYTAGELIRVLISHPQVELRYLQSESHRGESVGRWQASTVSCWLVLII